jgi:hypothetical protein
MNFLLNKKLENTKNQLQYGIYSIITRLSVLMIGLNRLIENAISVKAVGKEPIH